CGFVTPLQGPEADEHRKPEAVILEGNYWKRRIEVVMREYHKWRIYYKKRVDFFTNYRPPQMPTSSNFLEPPSFGPMADSLFSSGILGPEMPSPASSSSSPGTTRLQQDTVSELLRARAFFPPIPTPTPPQPPPGPATLAPPRSLIVPKAERLSPPAPSGSERRLSGDLNSIPPPGALSVHLSPPQPILSRGRVDNNKMENRRITHISAEQKRRFNIKLGFDTLHGLVSTLSAQPSLKVSPQPEMHTPLESWSPSLDQHPTPDPRACQHRGPHWWRSQVSKATTLQKTAEYILMLQQERAAMQEEAQQLRDEIEELNAAINLCQQQLPATGVPITHQRFDQMRDMFDDYVRTRTLHNWKFWVVSLLGLMA
ncbi:putative Williams-Beuren syndrome chromosomal region 14 protein like protein, partial [Cricetulus griseus]